MDILKLENVSPFTKLMHVEYWWENQKRPLGGPRCRWADNIEKDLREIL
jgi:hypothetical protein